MSVSIQQAAANAFALWLASKLPDVTVEPRWPSPDKKKPAKSITLVMAGRRRDTPIDLRTIAKTNVGATQVNAKWQVAACTQPFQLDVWATSDVARDDIIARLDSVLHADTASLIGAVLPMPVGPGALIKLADGWEDTVADFNFEEPDVDPDPNATGSAIYRATYRGNAHVMLTVSTLTARQIAINFNLRLSETDSPSDFPVTPITPPP